MKTHRTRFVHIRLWTNTIESGFPFLGWCPPDVGDVALNWVTKSLMFFFIVLYFIFVCWLLCYIFVPVVQDIT